ncbi:MAG: tetratricopeptide repeat protein [Candidatus Thorarchaeota archaeon]
MQEYYSEVKSYVCKGKYKDAILLIDKLLSSNDINQKNINELNLLKIEIFLMNGKYKKCITLIDEMKKRNHNNEFPLFEIDLLILYISFLIEIGKFDDVLKEIFKVEERLNKLLKLEKTEILLRKGNLLFNKGRIFLIKGNNEIALSIFQEVLDIFKDINNKKGIARTISQLAFVNREINRQDISISFYNEALSLQDENEDIYGKLISLKDLGTVYLLRGEKERAKEYYQKSLDIAEMIENNDYIGRLYNNFGIIEDLYGNLREAIDYYQKSLDTEKEFENIEIYAKTLNNIGSVYIRMGNLEKALENIEKSLEIFQKIGNVQNIINSFNHLGRIFVLKGNYEKALINFQMSLNMMDKITSHNFNSFTLYNYISTAILKNDLELAKEKLEILEQIENESTEPLIHYRTILAKALFLKQSARARNRVKAEEYFEEVIASEIPSYDLKVDAMLNLCDLKLMELKESKDSGLLEEAKKLANKVLEIAKNQRSMLLYAETYWLLSQIALIELDFDTARKLLTQAQLIAEEWEIRNLALKIALEHDKLLERLELWEKLSERNASLTERMELAELKDFFMKIIRDRKFDSGISPEEPIMFMLLKKSGTPIYSKHYLKNDKLDDSLVSGFLAAINAFAKETFSTTGPIERIRHNDYTIVIQSINPYLVCYIFHGQSYSALQRMIRIIDRIQKEEQIWNELLVLSESTNQITESIEKALDSIIDEVLI